MLNFGTLLAQSQKSSSRQKLVLFIHLKISSINGRNQIQLCFIRRGTLYLRMFMPYLIQEFRGNDEKILVILKCKCQQFSDFVSSCVIMI